MTLLSALEIAGNYPDNISIRSGQDGSGKWTSDMYMLRGGLIHKTMLSFDGFPFDSKEEAEQKMKDIADEACKYVNSLGQ